MLYKNFIKIANKFEIKIAIYNMSLDDACKVLDLPNHFTMDDLIKARKIKTLKYHPDVNKSPDATDKMKAINIAFEKLKPYVNDNDFNIGRQYNYEYDTNEDKPNIIFEINVGKYIGQTKRNYLADYEKTTFEKPIKTKVKNIFDVVEAIDNIINLGDKNIYIMVKQTGHYTANGVLGLIKYDYVDGRWFVVPAGWIASEGNYELEERNPHKSWDDVKVKWLKKYGSGLI